MRPEFSAVRCKNLISHVRVIWMSATPPIQLQIRKGKHELSLRIPRSVKSFAAAVSLVTVCFASLSCKLTSSYEHFTNRSEEFLGYRNAPQLRYFKFSHGWCWRSTSYGTRCPVSWVCSSRRFQGAWCVNSQFEGRSWAAGPWYKIKVHPRRGHEGPEGE